LYRNKANAPVGVVSPQINSVSVVNNQPQQGSIVSATQYGSGAQASQPVTIQTQPVQYGSRAQVSQPVTIQTQPVQYGSRVQASQPVSIQTQPAQPQPQQVSFQGPQPVSNIQMMGYSQQPPQTITNNNKVSVPTPRFANEKRIELGGPQIINFPRPEERVISEKIIEGAPYLQQPPPNHSVRVTTGAPGVQYPVVTREVQRVNGPLPPIPEQPFSVNSSLNIQRQEGAPILQFNNQQYT
jgi:hypothetical protein